MKTKYVARQTSGGYDVVRVTTHKRWSGDFYTDGHKEEKILTPRPIPQNNANALAELFEREGE